MREPLSVDANRIADISCMSQTGINTSGSGINTSSSGINTNSIAVVGFASDTSSGHNETTSNTGITVESDTCKITADSDTCGTTGMNPPTDNPAYDRSGIVRTSGDMIQIDDVANLSSQHNETVSVSQQQSAVSTQHLLVSTQASAVCTQASAVCTQESAVCTQESAVCTQESAICTQDSDERVFYITKVKTLAEVARNFLNSREGYSDWDVVDDVLADCAAYGIAKYPWDILKVFLVCKFQQVFHHLNATVSQFASLRSTGSFYDVRCLITESILQYKKPPLNLQRLTEIICYDGGKLYKKIQNWINALRRVLLGLTYESKEELPFTLLAGDADIPIVNAPVHFPPHRILFGCDSVNEPDADQSVSPPSGCMSPIRDDAEACTHFTTSASIMTSDTHTGVPLKPNFKCNELLTDPTFKCMLNADYRTAARALYPVDNPFVRRNDRQPEDKGDTSGFELQSSSDQGTVTPPSAKRSRTTDSFKRMSSTSSSSLSGQRRNNKEDVSCSSNTTTSNNTKSGRSRKSAEKRLSLPRPKDYLEELEELLELGGIPPVTKPDEMDIKMDEVEQDIARISDSENTVCQEIARISSDTNLVYSICDKSCDNSSQVEELNSIGNMWPYDDSCNASYNVMCEINTHEEEVTTDNNMMDGSSTTSHLGSTSSTITGNDTTGNDISIDVGKPPSSLNQPRGGCRRLADEVFYSTGNDTAGSDAAEGHVRAKRVKTLDEEFIDDWEDDSGMLVDNTTGTDIEKVPHYI